MPADVKETEGPLMKMSEKARQTRNLRRIQDLERNVEKLMKRLATLENMAGVK